MRVFLFSNVSPGEENFDMLTDWIIPLLNVILINVVLSGDNAVIIALASRNLPPHLQKRTILWGSVGAVVLRMLLCFVAIWLLKIPFLQLAGGLLLVWIAVKLMVSEEETEQIEGSSSLIGAVKTILVSDFIMSLDNVVAVTAAAKENIWLIGMGIGLSVPLIIWGSKIFSGVMKRFPVILYVGAAVIAWAAGEMIKEERMLHGIIEQWGAFSYAIPVTLTLVVLLYGWIHHRREQVHKRVRVERQNVVS
jgi:YjbE family integral membrane protein